MSDSSKLTKLSALAFAVALAALQTWWCVKVQPLHADLLYLESVYTDVILLGRSVTMFLFTEAYFLFPDGLLYLAVRPFMPSAAWGLTAYAFVFTLGYLGVTYFIFRKIWGVSRSVWHFLLGSLAVVALSGTIATYLNTAYWPNHHGALQLVFLAFLIQLVYVPRLSPRALALLTAADFVCSALLSFSDMVSVLAVLTPAILLFGCKRWKLAAGCGLGILAGYFVNYILLHSGVIAAVPLMLDETDWPKILLSIYHFPRSLPVIVLKDWILFSTFAALAAATYFQPIVRADARWLSCFKKLSWLSLVITALGIVATGRWAAPDLFYRYYQQLYYIPLLWITLWGIPSVPLTRRWAQGLLAVGTVAFALFLAETPSPTGMLSDPPLTQCLDSHARDLPTPWGLGGFYPAKLVTFTSHEKLHVNQVKKNFSAYAWMVSASWFKEDIYGREIEGHTFLLARDQSEAERAIAKWGPPARTYSCPASTFAILVYPEGINPGNWDKSPND